MKRVFLTILLALSVQSGKVLADSLPKKALVGLSGWVIFSDPDSASLRDFEKHASQVDRVYFDWYHCDENGLPVPNPEATEELKARAREAAHQGQCQAWFMVTNWDSGFNTKFDGDRLRLFLHDGGLKKKHIQALVDFAKQDQVQGIQVHYQGLGQEDRYAFTSFMQELSEACKKNKLLLGVVVYGKNLRFGKKGSERVLDYRSLGKAVDEIVRMPQQFGFGHGPLDPAGFLDSPTDMEVVLKFMASVVNPSKMEVEAPIFGYDWVDTQGKAASWDQLAGILEDQEKKPSRDEYSQELFLEYPERHKIWFADGKSFEFMADLAKRYKTYGTSVWYFGGEGPDFWKTLERVEATLKETAKVTASLVETSPSHGPRVHPTDIFTDKLRGYYFYTDDNDPNDPNNPNTPGNYGVDNLSRNRDPAASRYAEGTPQSNFTVIEKSDKFWADFKLVGDQNSSGYIGVGHLDLSPYLEKGALQFFVKGIKGGESLRVGFNTSPGLGDLDQYELENSVPLQNYIEVTTRWKLVTIPLGDFPERIEYVDEEISEKWHLPFNWNRIHEFTIKNEPGGDDFVEFQIANVRVIPFYDRKSVSPP